MGATVHLVGRTLEKLDALNETAIDEHAASVVSSAGSVDISMNVVTHNDVQGTPLVEMPLADFGSPVRTNFLTARRPPGA
ncbi:hypothetical protein [Amycolatopsis coloradensis]|uniref:hypothetical protein n=1 Tax=Amycolatopsis coloradensis TaxID=76021 RepID=UPI001FC8F992|nr:hypothetical protein [Amycolatopsis coloradensis]